MCNQQIRNPIAIEVARRKATGRAEDKSVIQGRFRPKGSARAIAESQFDPAPVAGIREGDVQVSVVIEVRRSKRINARSLQG